MNIINIILLAILLISFISGMQKGFLASLLATLGFVAAWLIASSLCSTLANHFMNSSFKEALAGLDPFRELVAKLGENANAVCNGAASSLNGICETLTEASVPKAVIDAFRGNAASASFAALTIGECLTQTIWQSTFNVISFVIVFAIAYAALILVVNLINNMFRLPKLRGVDGLLGGVFGVVRGYAVICLIAAVVPMIYTALDSSVVQTLFADSSMGTFFLNGDSLLSDLFRISSQIENVMREMPKVIV